MAVLAGILCNLNIRIQGVYDILLGGKKKKICGFSFLIRLCKNNVTCSKFLNLYLYSMSLIFDC